MGTKNKNTGYKYCDIKGIKDLEYQRRILCSKIEHQEIMISYQVRSLREYMTPKRILYSGLSYLAARNTFANSTLKVFDFVRSLFRRNEQQ